MSKDISQGRVFLSATWSNLAVINYEINPGILEGFVPKHTELDFFKGSAFVSLVGFWFHDTKLLAKIPIPFHRHFEEVNLRFYVKRNINGEERRGVVFIKELVPKPLIAWVARRWYAENYEAVPMSHQWHFPSIGQHQVSYQWKYKGQVQQIMIECESSLADLRQNSFEEFILEHYWGYAVQREGSTVEYQVAHPRWQFWPGRASQVNINGSEVYGEVFLDTLSQKPHSFFVAKGSPVEVYQGRRI